MVKTIITIVLWAGCGFALFWLLKENIKKGKTLAQQSQKLNSLKYLLIDIPLSSVPLAVGVFIGAYVLSSYGKASTSNFINTLIYAFTAVTAVKIFFKEIPKRLAYRHYKKKNKDWTKGDYFGVQ